MPQTPGLRTRDLASEETSLLKGLQPPVTSLPSRKHASEGPERWKGGFPRSWEVWDDQPEGSARVGLQRTMQDELRSQRQGRSNRSPWRVIPPQSSLFPPLRITENSLWKTHVPCTSPCCLPTFVAKRKQVPQLKAEAGKRSHEGSKPCLAVVNLYFFMGIADLGQI